MKKILIFGFILLNSMCILAQDAVFTVSISPEEVLMDNYIEVTFTLENAKGQHFDAPVFSEFEVVSGPNQSSNFSMVNGTVSQSQSYSYYLLPKAPGNYYIQAASIEVDGAILETTPLEVIVQANPDGIKKENPMNQGFNDSFFNFDFDFGPKMDTEEKPKKKKRKTYKL